MKEYIIIFVTCKDGPEAKMIAQKLLADHLAACANIADNIQSFFHWKGKIDAAQEVLLLIKTRRDLFDAVRHVVRDLHSYDVPEILAVPVVDGDEEYLNWIETETRMGS